MIKLEFCARVCRSHLVYQRNHLSQQHGTHQRYTEERDGHGR